MFNLMRFYNFPHEKKKVKYFPNDSYTGVFIRPRTVTKLRTLGQLRHRSVAIARVDSLNYSDAGSAWLCSTCQSFKLALFYTM